MRPDRDSSNACPSIPPDTSTIHNSRSETSVHSDTGPSPTDRSSARSTHTSRPKPIVLLGKAPSPPPLAEPIRSHKPDRSPTVRSYPDPPRHTRHDSHCCSWQFAAIPDRDCDSSDPSHPHQRPLQLETRDPRPT